MSDLELVATFPNDNVIDPPELLEYYKVIAYTFYKCHQDRARMNMRMATSYNILIILITGFTGSSSLALLFEDDQNLQVLNVILGYLVATLGTFYKYFTPEKRKQQHRTAAEEYLRLYNKIIQSITFNAITIEWIKDVNQQLEELREISPVINDTVYEKFKASCKQLTYKSHKHLV